MRRVARIIMRALETELPIPREWPSHTVGGVVQAIALARFALMHVRGWCANSPIARVRLAGERDAALGELAAVREEVRILRERVVAIRSAERPRYPPTLRAAILVLRAARGWTITETARRFVLTEATIASWMKRLDEGGPDALVALGTPVNRFPDFVGELVRRLRASFPALGKKRIADLLARSGLHLAVATVARMLKRKPPSPKGTTDGSATEHVDEVVADDIAAANAKPRAVTAKAPHHVWHIDFTLLPLVSGGWTAWFPFSLIQRWPFAFWLGVVLDQYSRSVVAWRLWLSQPSADEVVALLDDARARARSSPKHLVSDRGPQFRETYLAWCAKHAVKPRFGAVGQHGSIAVLERFWRSLKSEMLRRLPLVPMALHRMTEEIVAYLDWYHVHRPHQGLGGRTPLEVLNRVLPAREAPHLEPRPDFPLSRGDPRQTQRRVQGVLLLDVRLAKGRKHLPIVRVREAA